MTRSLRKAGAIGALFVACCTQLAAQTPNKVITSGSWSNPESWLAGVPTSQHAVTIPPGYTISIDGPIAAQAASISVAGTLDVPSGTPFTASITTDRIEVAHGGRFTVGTSAAPFVGDLTITLTESLVTPSDAKRIMVFPGGELSLFGDSSQASWARLGPLPAPGWQGGGAPNAAQLVLDQNVSWNQGDSIVVSSTDYDMEQAEPATLASNATGQSLLLNSNLVHPHYSSVLDSRASSNTKSIDMRAAVGRLTRNIRIVGDTGSEARWGGDLMIMEDELSNAATPTATRATLSFVEFARMGKYGALGRYPIHFHKCGDMSNRALVEGCSIHEAYHRAVVVHGTHNVVVRDNVAYDVFGHAFMLEDGDETGNRFEHNLGMVVRTPEVEPTDPQTNQPINRDLHLGEAITWSGATFTAFGGQFFRYHDRTPAVFWISNYANEYVDNVAAGSEGYGFTFDMAILDYTNPDNPWVVDQTRKARTLSGPFRQRIQSSGPGTFEFSGNAAFACGRSGFFADNDATGRARAVEINQGTVMGHYTFRFLGNTAFKCRRAGIWYRQYGENIWQDCRLADNLLGVYFGSEGFTSDGQHWTTIDPTGWGSITPWSSGVASVDVPTMSHAVLFDSLVLGISDNIGSPLSPDWATSAAGSRTLPYANRLIEPNASRVFASTVDRREILQHNWAKGVDIYDGLNAVVDTHFQDFFDQMFGESLRRGAVFGVKQCGERGRWASPSALDTAQSSPWPIDPRNYVRGVTFDQCNYIGWPAPRAPQQRVTQYPAGLPTSMAWFDEFGVEDAVIYDLDGSITGTANTYVVNANTQLMINGGAVGANNPIDSGEDPDFYWMPDSLQLGEFVIEYPWDYAQTGSPVADRSTTLFRNLTVRRVGSGTTAQVFDMTNAGATLSPAAYQQTRESGIVSQMIRKRMFGFNARIDHAGANRYAVAHEWPNATMTEPNVHVPVDFVVRLRFGENSCGAILEIPYSYHPSGTPASAAAPLAVKLVTPPTRPNSSIPWTPYQTTFRPASPSWSEEQTAAWSQRLYNGTAIPESASLTALEGSTGSAWRWDAATQTLQLKIHMPSQPRQGPNGQTLPRGFRGQEVVILVESAY